MKLAKVVIRNIADVDWQEFPGHHGGALSKQLVSPDTTDARRLDYRISSYARNAYVERHAHKAQEQVYHVLQGAGLFDFGDQTQRIGQHDVIFIPPGIEHAIRNTGLDDLVFLVVTAPANDR